MFLFLCEYLIHKRLVLLQHDTELDDELVMEENMVTPFQRKASGLLNGHLLMHRPGEITPLCNDGAAMLDQGEYAKCTWKRRRAPFQARGRPSKRVRELFLTC